MDLRNGRVLATELANWSEDLEYHLGNYRRAKEVGSLGAADNSRALAAQAAAILTALKGGA